MKKKMMYALAMIMMVIFMTGCTEDYSVTMSANTEDPSASEAEESEPITFEAKMYDHQGNNFLNFQGNHFEMTPNKIKQYGWDTDGSWISYYDTSSVVTIEVDGHYIQSCGSTVIFKDTRLQMLEIPSELSTTAPRSDDGYEVSQDPQSLQTYLGLTNWWYDIKEKGQHGEKIVLIQSQDGFNIGAFVGDDITWKVAEKLPKTTLITVDGLPLYIHRCNFTMIDTALIQQDQTTGK